MNELLRISLGFRQHPVAIVMDLEKFYQSVNMVERDQHVCRILWRDCIQEAEPQIYKMMTVNFGDKSAGTIAQCARAYMEVNPEAAQKIIDKMSDVCIQHHHRSFISRGGEEDGRQNEEHCWHGRIQLQGDNNFWRSG